MNEIDPFAPEARQKKRVKYWFVPGHFRLTWVEDSFNPDISSTTADFVSRGTSHVGSSLTSKRLSWLSVGLSVILLFLFGRLVYLQLWAGEKFRALAVNNSERVLPIPAERGLIFDRTGKQLVENIPSFSLFLTPTDLPRAEFDPAARTEAITKISTLSGVPAEEINEIISKYKAYRADSVVLREDIDYETALRLRVQSAGVPGLLIAQGSKRWYGWPASAQNAYSPSSTTPLSLSHLVGYMGKLSPEELKSEYQAGYLPTDSIGKLGLEKSYEAELRGVPGRRRLQVNSSGKEQSVLAEVAPVAGKHLQLSVDSVAEAELEKIMSRYINKPGASGRGVGIVTEVKTGAVIAMVSLPAFDNNDFSGGITSSTYQGYLQNERRPLFNRAIAGLYPSGSTVKPVVAAGAMEENVISSETSFLSNGGLKIGQWFFPDWKPGGHGQTNVTKSIAWSVNTFYYYIGGGYGNFNGLGVERITSYMRKFGLGRVLGIDLPGEQTGFVPSRQWKEQTKKEMWYIGDTYNLSIGQGDLLVTPLQIAAMTGAIANGGTLNEPHLATQLIDPVSGERTDLKFEPVRRELAKPYTLAVVRQGMRECVEYGSCRQLSALPIPVSGKTGTAQWNSTKPNHAWFTSFAPSDKPEITVTVMVEEGGEGSSISVPIANEFYQWWAKNRSFGTP